jgi:hypothetical protein
VDEELNAVIVEESKKGEKEQEEARPQSFGRDNRIYLHSCAKEDDYLVDDELKAVIVKESKKGEKDWEEEEQAEQIKGFKYQLINGLMVMQVLARTTVPGS